MQIHGSHAQSAIELRLKLKLKIKIRELVRQLKTDA